MDVHLLQHIRHARNLDGSPAEHRDVDGELNFDDQYDGFKIIGIYSSSETAQGGINRARKLAGFQDEPDFFIIDTYMLDNRQLDRRLCLHPGRKQEWHCRPVSACGYRCRPS